METYEGSCHCGKVTFRAQFHLTDKVDECNCSYCRRGGMWWQAVDRKNFEILSGADNLKSYAGKRRLYVHYFCQDCGVNIYADNNLSGEGRVDINIRTIPSVDLEKLSVGMFDGKSL